MDTNIFKKFALGFILFGAFSVSSRTVHPSSKLKISMICSPPLRAIIHYTSGATFVGKPSPAPYQVLGHPSDVSCKLRDMGSLQATQSYCLSAFSDGPGFRTLQGAAQAGPTNTIESCIAFCESKNYVYAGTEYGVSGGMILLAPC